MITPEEWEKNGVTVAKPCLRVTQIQPTKKLDGQAQARQQPNQVKPSTQTQSEDFMDDGIPF